MPHAYSEDTLVEKPAIEFFAGLGWQTISAFNEVFRAETSPPLPSPNGRGAGAEGAVSLGREHAGEVVLLCHLVPALKKLNPKAPLESDQRVCTEAGTAGSAGSLPVAPCVAYIVGLKRR